MNKSANMYGLLKAAVSIGRGPEGYVNTDYLRQNRGNIRRDLASLIQAQQPAQQSTQQPATGSDGTAPGLYGLPYNPNTTPGFGGKNDPRPFDEATRERILRSEREKYPNGRPDANGQRAGTQGSNSFDRMRRLMENDKRWMDQIR